MNGQIALLQINLTDQKQLIRSQMKEGKQNVFQRVFLLLYDFLINGKFYATQTLLLL
jgi:hypothetical protein